MKKNKSVEKRQSHFASKAQTKIWKELPSQDNPFISTGAICHGYDIFDLAEKCSFVEVFFLLFKGELPTQEQRKLLNKLMIISINPGTRNVATRAAMSIGVSKTLTSNILPVSLPLLSGKFRGGQEIEESMRFLMKNFSKKIEQVYSELDLESFDQSEENTTLAPGFGRHYGGADTYSHKILSKLAQDNKNWKYLNWALELSKMLLSRNYAVTYAGAIAAGLLDLTFLPREAVGIYQLLSAPGVLALGLEQSVKPLTSMPFVSDENYYIED